FSRGVPQNLLILRGQGLEHAGGDTDGQGGVEQVHIVDVVADVGEAVGVKHAQGGVTPVHSPLLQGGQQRAPGDGGGVDAQRLVGGQVGGGLHAADLQTIQVLRGPDGGILGGQLAEAALGKAQAGHAAARHVV